MSEMLSGICLAVFLCLPIVVLAVRMVRPRRMPWWIAITGVLVLGWLLILVAAMLNETPDRGAPKVFALFIGWAYALTWFIPWLLVYGTIQRLRRWHAKLTSRRIAKRAG